MRRGEIWEVDLEPTRGSEASKRRPAVIVSNNAANAVVERLRRGTITVVPLTSNVRNVRKFQVMLPAARTKLRLNSKAQAEQVRALAFERFGRRMGTVPTDLMAAIDDALRIQLDL
ncbi:MAG: type II toxin-antitoxin system PemK/MazF family toxin [Chloroflexota bacterium]